MIWQINATSSPRLHLSCLISSFWCLAEAKMTLISFAWHFLAYFVADAVWADLEAVHNYVLWEDNVRWILQPASRRCLKTCLYAWCADWLPCLAYLRCAICFWVELPRRYLWACWALIADFKAPPPTAEATCHCRWAIKTLMGWGLESERLRCQYASKAQHLGWQSIEDYAEDNIPLWRDLLSASYHFAIDLWVTFENTWLLRIQSVD